MTASQIWIIIGVFALILFIIGILRGGYFVAREQRIGDQRGYKPLRDTQPTVFPGQEDSLGSSGSRIVWGDVESNPMNSADELDLPSIFTSSSAPRIYWGNDSGLEPTDSSDLPSTSTIYWGEPESTQNSQIAEPISDDLRTQLPVEKRKCPICKQEIDESTSGIVICNGSCDTHYHHKCLEDYEGICLICKTKLL